MLSSPPPAFAASTSARAAARDRRGAARASVEDLVVGDHRRQPVGAEQEDVARLRLDRERVDVDVGIGAERARDHRALRMGLRLLRRELAAAHELGDERVVVGELLELRRRARGRRASRRRGRRRRASPSTSATVIVVPIPRPGRVVVRALEDPPVRLLDQRRDALSGRARRRRPRRARPPRGRDATSPAWAPPIPSATAKSGGSQTKESSFRRRLRPGVGESGCAATLIART